MDRNLCNFNPMTGEEEPMNEDCRKSVVALDMAIKLLEQEPCEDAVSRQAVLDVDFKRIVLTTAKPAETIRQKIQELPSVTPVRKKGKWIRVDHNKVKCSECEITHLIAQYPHGAINFCPNCGAKNCPLVEIATCKDCKYYYPDEDGRGYHCERDSHVRFSVYRDFYCADAERRK